MTTSNCETCEYKRFNTDPKLHCYMFKVAPDGVCAQHRLSKVMRGYSDLVAALAIVDPPFISPPQIRVDYSERRWLYKKTWVSKGSQLAQALDNKDKKNAEKIYQATTKAFDAVYPTGDREWFENWSQQ